MPPRLFLANAKPLAVFTLFLLISARSVAAVPSNPPPQPGSLASPASDSTSTEGLTSLIASDDSLPDSPQAQTSAVPGTPSTTATAPASGSPQQTKRILFIVPNFRSVTADVKLPPMSVKEKFKLVLDDTFDYSGFIEVGILSGVSDYHKSEPEFGHGAAAYGRYYWHGFADATDGNFMTEFLVPVVTHEDPRFYTLGHGGVIKRTSYSISRLFITRSDLGRPTPNFSEIVGNGAASGISNFYYPSPDRNWTKTGQRWVLQVGIDGLANLVKEFWPDINARIFHDKY
jgi:hypothetical protein